MQTTNKFEKKTFDRESDFSQIVNKLTKLSSENQNKVLEIINKFPSKKEFNVLLLTPYLIENISNMAERKGSVKAVEEEIQKYGYRPDKVMTDKFFENDDMMVNYIYDVANISMRNDLDEWILSLPQKEKFIFAVCGSARAAEKDVENLKKTDIPVGRYSTFYGKNSEYSDKSAAEGGYSFDIPKNPDIVYDIIKNTDFLSALSEKDIKGIQQTLKTLNKKFKEIGGSVLITSYLEECLKK